MIRFLFDNTEVDNPANFEELESALKLDEVLNAVLLVEDTSLTFVGSAYDYLTTKELEGFCTVIDVTVQDTCGGNVYSTIIEGKIFISDIIFNERLCTATAKIRDRSFYSMINNNKSVEVVATTNQTKNLEVMTPATLYNLDVYGLNNVLLFNNVPSYRIFEVLRTAVAFLTDNRVGFASTIFDIGGDYEGWCITNGAMLRTATIADMTSSTFDKIIRELKARLPIKFTIENPYTAPVLRIELEDYFNGTDTAFAIDDIYEITRKYEVNKLYSRVDIGSSVVDADLSLSFPENIRFLGFSVESYTVLGECNIDTTLSLQGDWIVSSNVIEAITTNGDQGYDNNIILFASVLTDASNGRTSNSNFLNLDPPLYYYNESLTNQAIFGRYVGAIPNSLAAFSGAKGDGIFRAFVGSPVAVGSGLFVNNSLDTTNVAVNTGGYFDGTDKFTAGVAGVYDINIHMEFNCDVFAGNRADIALRIRQYDSTNTLVQTVSPRAPTGGASYSYFSTGLKIFDRSARVVMNAGNYLQLSFTKLDQFGTTSEGDITVDTYWECEENTVGGGIFKDYDYQDYPINIFEFEYPLTATQWQTLIADPKQKINFAMEGQSPRTAYIKNVTRNHVTGVTTFSLINTTTQNAS
jgi:hypothetical protein